LIREEQLPQTAPENDDIARLTLECYLASLLTMAECIEAACPAVGVQYSDQLVRVRRRLAFDYSQRSLVDARDAVETTLAGYADQANRYCEHQLDDLRHILEALNEVEELTKDGPNGVAERIDAVRKRLIGSKELVSADALTGLPNRRELERQIKIRLAGDKRFCVVFFDIDDFGLFNETLGRGSGDQILKQVGDRLSTHIRAGDVAARWVADEFVLVLECDLENARRRSKQMAQWLRGPYTLMQEDGEAKLEIRLSTAVAECAPGDTTRQIWLRLEEDFHHNNPATIS